ncbi:MAG: RES family NAD+ phosphorylase [Gloeobacteraceae cyanobacterium ES-bin-144]|nr:RES family NAD+ phosphorylase [Verrucomicrobiales bacterium]
MAKFYRIVQAHWAASAMSGEGARLNGGRWNPPGISAVYLAESRALAALEMLVHAPREVLHLAWRLIEVEVPEKWIVTARHSALPADWQALPSSPSARQFGEAWLSEPGSLALKLPSVLIPEEHTLLLNPLHPDAARMKISKPLEFRFDPRF